MIDQDRMLAFRSDLQRIADGNVVTGTQMMFAFQRFVAIVLDGEVVGVITPTATSSDDVPHDEPDPLADPAGVAEEVALGDQPNTTETIVNEGAVAEDEKAADPLPPAEPAA